MLLKRCKCADKSRCSHKWAYDFQLYGERHQRSTGTANRQKAERIETKAQADALDQKEGIAAPKVLKLAAHIEDYIAYTAQHNKTAYKDRAVLTRLEDEIGNKDLQNIVAFDIERWKAARAKDVSRQTVNRELNIVRGCFTRAVAWKRLAQSPLVGVDSYDVDDGRIRTFDDAELRTVLAIGDQFVALVCRLTLVSLARLSAVLGLKRTHIGASWVETKVKGGKVFRVPVPADLRAALLARTHASGFVFGEDEFGGDAPTQQAATNRVLRAFRSAGIEDASHHTCRHTGVTMMLERGVNPRVIQTLAGWTSLRMLERYGHVRDAETLRAVNGIAAHLGELEASATPIDAPAELPSIAT